jgi:hypothetical protein
LQRHLRAQFAVKRCQHRQAAAAKQLGLIGDGEKLKKDRRSEVRPRRESDKTTPSFTPRPQGDSALHSSS